MPAASSPTRPARSPAQLFFLSGALLCIVGVVFLAAQPLQIERHVQGALIFAWLALAAVFGLMGSRPHPLSARRLVPLGTLLAVVLLYLLAFGVGQGLRTVSLGLVPLLIGLVAMLAGLRQAALLCAVALAGVLALAAAERHGLLNSAAAIAAAPASDALSAHIVLLLGSLLGGAVTAATTRRWRDADSAREAQFGQLLTLAADHFWQLDATLRFAPIERGAGRPIAGMPAQVIGTHPWDDPRITVIDPTPEAHWADLRAHRPFDQVIVTRQRHRGGLQYLSLSGRPRFSADGSFIGYWGVGRDVTASREQQNALARARDEAEAANRAKSAFLANVSHEIRTPLNGLVGLADLAQQPGASEAQRREYLALIGDSANALTAVISDILDLSKIEAGKLALDVQTFELPALLASLKQAYGALCEARGLTFSLECDPALPRWVAGDRVRLRQVLANFLNNSLKFTSQGQVRLAARCGSGDEVHIEVVDSGIGIAEADQSRLFQPFSQLEEARPLSRGGTGLGLSICRELATLMQGRVGVQSRPGQGSRFWIELPLPAHAAPAGDPASDEAADTRRLRGTRVLLAEDNPVNMMIGVAMLQRWGVMVEQAADGLQAVDAVQRAAAQGRPFDLVLMDIQMPGLNGRDAARQLRQTWDAQALPIIALSAAAMLSEQQAAFDAGMDHFVAKPFDAATLRAALLRALG